MAMRPLSYPEVTAGENNGDIAFVSMFSMRQKIFFGQPGEPGFEDYIDTTWLDFNTAGYDYRIYVWYSPYGGITPIPSEPITYPPFGNGRPPMVNYGHRIFSIYDASVGQTGSGFRAPTHWAAGWHVFAEIFDPLVGWVPNRFWDFNYQSQTIPFTAFDFACCYISPMHTNKGQTVQFAGNNTAPGVNIVQAPIQGINGRTNTSPGGAWNESGVTSITRGVSNDTTMAREFFFVANLLFDPNGFGDESSPPVYNGPYNPQQGIHNVTSSDSPPFTHCLTVKPRYNTSAQKGEPLANRGQPMPHGVVLSAWVREIKTMGQATPRFRTVQPIQDTYNSSSLSLIIKGGNFGPAHTQAF